MLTEDYDSAVASFDLIVVGAGILGLAHALAAARRGLRVAVVERDARAAGASVRNFGFVTVSGQADGPTRARALRSRAVWAEVAAPAGIDVLQRGAMVVARRAEALAVLREFASGAMGEGCEVMNAREATHRIPRLREAIAGALSSPHELRVEAREAIPRLARWLEGHHRVAFTWGVAALGVEATSVRHAGGRLDADAVVVTPGGAVTEFAPALAQRVRLRHCKLQMMRLRVPAPDFRLPAVVMSDLSLARYEGFASQPAARRLRERLDAECGRELANGVHLIVAQSADGSLVVGDSHHYDDHHDSLSRAEVEGLILGELHSVFALPGVEVVERWIGHYPVTDAGPVLAAELAPRARLVAVTSGTGMSTAFAIGEETVASLFG